MEEEKRPVELPENAYRELKEGEEYQPVMNSGKAYPEANFWSIGCQSCRGILSSQIGIQHQRHAVDKRSLFGN